MMIELETMMKPFVFSHWTDGYFTYQLQSSYAGKDENCVNFRIPTDVNAQ